MDRETKPIPAGVGFRVKSGWAMAALVTGSADEPQLAICRSVLLSDPKIPQSVQPHHAELRNPGKEGKAVTQGLRRVVRTSAKKSVRALLNEAVAARYTVRGAALVVGSLVDPATLHNEHIRAHGLEGQLFRTVLEDALRASKIPCAASLEKSAYEVAGPILGKTPAQIKRAIAKLGESREGSWRAEEKLAALGGWVALAKAEGKKRVPLRSSN